MLKYLVILLNSDSVSYCYYRNNNNENKWMPLDVLERGILFAMKNNLSIQYVYPEKEIPGEYYDSINRMNHIDIKPYSTCGGMGDVIILNEINDISKCGKDAIYIVHFQMKEAKELFEYIINSASSYSRLNLVISDMDKVTNHDIHVYEKDLQILSSYVEKMIVENGGGTINLLSDRLYLSRMNNCNAAVESITLAPNGKFYICPAFYVEDLNDYVGDIFSGLDIKNRQLYFLDHAPICRICDAFHCKRCIWLNKKKTLEVNIPSSEQCVIAHVERNFSKQILERINKYGKLIDNEIVDINYLDPINKI